MQKIGWLGCIDRYGWAALLARIRPGKAEAEGFGGSKVEADNAVWPNLRRNPMGRGHFSSSHRHSSLADTRYASLLTPRSEKKWLPSLPARICRYTLGAGAAMLCALVGFEQLQDVKAAGGPMEGGGLYRVLAPIESGNLLLFPVVRVDGKSAGESPYVTLDEGLKDGEVEVTEAGRATGLVRPRGGQAESESRRPGEYAGAGEPLQTAAAAAGGRDCDRRQAGPDHRQGPHCASRMPIPSILSVFCIEPGRWTESSASFGAAAKSAAKSFMVQPEVREQAMVGAGPAAGVGLGAWRDLADGGGAPPPAPAAGRPSAGSMARRSLGTTSYAKVMESAAVSQKVDEAAAPVMQGARTGAGQVARGTRGGRGGGGARGDFWADLFANTDLLARYWTKLVRSYAAESLTGGEDHAAPSVADAQHFLDAPANGSENERGRRGRLSLSRVEERTTRRPSCWSRCCPGTGYDVHISKMKLRGSSRRRNGRVSATAVLRTAELLPQIFTARDEGRDDVTLFAGHAPRAALR